MEDHVASPARIRAKQRHNVLSRHHGTDAPVTLAARRDLRAAQLEEHIRDVVATAPALTAEQLERLRGLLPAADIPDTGEAA
jgi:hypothetical protein